ncbi:LysR family transcriptional regulator [Agrobacterium tumefaciens]|uniref:LysR family transcriptional regulator n=1 Tax=Agrobacterium tumefaciens TaxID=358 RepID=UPI00080FE721|nr:LysR family transcriptional regulator [Agrobacterium tumefaciens]NSL20083.1 LysR family transcriptional regulator [Agrobacterium tumefaciens]NTC54772.1 LysR family transcriptional regulator [Agrobacterium tumefaciens]NTC61581.1 LysR family transcriptional regulator [Agrobacterium tumefaciens]NTC69748.1 LysR family transcriptional regulator [Agrobacterium tumefaciens]NTC71593.1 LysR family transcriptional regulator [Agrobacterium tumefaciens]
MNTRFLETFLWAARLNSFSAAAERLNTTQASVSNRIAALERELGVVLFTRDVRCVNLTPAGRLALQHAEKIVNLTGEFRQIVSSREALRGTVRIGAADTIVYAWLPLLIRRMNERYPGVSLDLTIDTSLKLSQRIQNGEVDVGFIMGPIMAANIYNSPLCTFESCWVGAVELPLPETGVTLEDIAHFPLLTFSTGSQPHQALRALLDSHGLSDSRIYNSNSLSIMTRLVAAAVGVGALPRVLVDGIIKSGEARILDISPSVPPLIFHTVYQERGDNAIARAIADMATEIVSETTTQWMTAAA